MKNMAQVIVSLVFAGSLALSIGACGSSGSGNFLTGTYLGGFVAGESYFPDSAGPASAGFEARIAGVIRLEIAGNGAITGALYTFADGPSGIIDDLDEDDAEVSDQISGSDVTLTIEVDEGTVVGVGTVTDDGLLTLSLSIELDGGEGIGFAGAKLVEDPGEVYIACGGYEYGRDEFSDVGLAAFLLDGDQLFGVTGGIFSSVAEATVDLEEFVDEGISSTALPQESIGPITFRGEGVNQIDECDDPECYEIQSLVLTGDPDNGEEGVYVVIEPDEDWMGLEGYADHATKNLAISFGGDTENCFGFAR
ncbi:MAG: hypothetical protein KIT79_11550 [Deltaproteobacteria bacterium]|nr:hypothetical protein [Deltaproteobacteria bacterium]